MNVRQRAELVATSLENDQPDPRLFEDAELRSLHNLAHALRQVRHPELDTAALIAGTVRVREALVSRRPAQAGRPHWLTRMAWAALALLLVLAVTTTGTTLAAESSLPGQVLYPVKRAAEAVRLALTWGPQSRAVLRIEFAERRLVEVAAVCGEDECPAELLDDLGRQTRAAQEAVEGLPVEKHAVLLDRMVALTTHQEQVLTRILATAPDAARPGLERALENSRRGHERAQQAQEKDKEKGKGKENAPISPPRPSQPTKAPHGRAPSPPGRKP